MDTTSLESQLIHEVWRNDIPAIKRLLAAGANPNLPGRAWSSAIACAGENDETGEVATVLVEAGADINIQDEAKQTPLHHAVDVAIDSAGQGRHEVINWSVVEVFLSLGADPTIEDSQGDTAFDIASCCGGSVLKSFEEFLRSRNRS